MEPPVAEVAPPAKSPGRAGRNLPAAIGVGVGLGGTVVACLAISRAAFVALVSIAVLIAVWELTSAIATKNVRAPLVPLALGSVAMLVAGYQGGTESLVVGLLLTVLAVVGWRLVEGPEGFASDVTAGILTAVYVPFLAGFTILMNAPHDGARRVATFVIVVVCNDVGGYAAGVLFGKHPMAPRISPKKSWEGMAGSLTACAAGGAICVAVMIDGGSWWQGALMGLALSVAATVGDLGESVIKRDLGVKDMGTLLPGHGGLMDRLDSLLIAAPVAWLLLAAIVNPR
jgi:phosphatidate cytidylyltransferase